MLWTLPFPMRAAMHIRGHPKYYLRHIILKRTCRMEKRLGSEEDKKTKEAYHPVITPTGAPQSVHFVESHDGIQEQETETGQDAARSPDRCGTFDRESLKPYLERTDAVLPTRTLLTSWFGVLMVLVQILGIFLDAQSIRASYAQIDELGLNLNLLVVLSITVCLVSVFFHHVLLRVIRKPFLKGEKRAILSGPDIILIVYVFLAGGLLMMYVTSAVTHFSGYSAFMRSVMSSVQFGWATGAVTMKLGFYLWNLLDNSIIVWGIASMGERHLYVAKRANVLHSKADQAAR